MAVNFFLLPVPFAAVLRVTTANFYATEKSGYSYILTFTEPVFMLVLMMVLPPMLGGLVMIWWSAVCARVLAALLAMVLKGCVERQERYLGK